MHQIDFDLNLKDISKIEGHTQMDVNVRNGEVVGCKLKIDENKRFFTTAILGKKYNTVSSTMSRICGTCSVAHALCAIKAVENAFNVQVTEQTKRLRELTMNAGHLRDHAMHLYFFVLPDFLGKDSVLDFNDEEHHWIHDGLDLKDAGNYVSTIIGGRSVHPPNAVAGGFTAFPKTEEVEEAKKKLIAVRDKIFPLIDFLTKNKIDLRRKTNYIGLVSEKYSFVEGKIKTALGTIIEEKDFGNHFERVVLPYSHATGMEFESKEYLVGSLARMNINKEFLNPKTKESAKEALKTFPSSNVFDNNLAQAIEVLNCIDNCIDLLNIPIKPEKLVEIKPKESTGIGVVEAPRGTLYYRLDFNKDGAVTFADLCIPTQQNLFHIENSVARRVNNIINKSKEEISLEVEKVIRAYDPCMSCAAHFLKINWI